MKEDLVVGFSDEDKNRVRTHLRKLFKYLTFGNFVIVGGLAIRFHAARKGIPFELRSFNDLDIVARGYNAVNPSIKNDFLVYHHHYHPNDPKYADNFFFALVDPVSRTKVDIFDCNPYTLDETYKVEFEGNVVELRTPEDQLVTAVLEASWIFKGAKMDTKKFLDIDLLFKLSDLKLAEKIWQKKEANKHEVGLIETYKKIKDYAKAHPELVLSKVTYKDTPYQCEGCCDANGFCIVPMQEVYDILGYVE